MWMDALWGLSMRISAFFVTIVTWVSQRPKPDGFQHKSQNGKLQQVYDLSGQPWPFSNSAKGNSAHLLPGWGPGHTWHDGCYWSHWTTVGICCSLLQILLIIPAGGNLLPALSASPVTFTAPYPKFYKQTIWAPCLVNRTCICTLNEWKNAIIHQSLPLHWIFFLDSRIE